MKELYIVTYISWDGDRHIICKYKTDAMTKFEELKQYYRFIDIYKAKNIITYVNNSHDGIN